MASFPASTYRGFGLCLQSELPLPELREGAAEDTVDVEIVMGAALRPDGLTAVAGMWAGPDAFWLEVPNCARFLVRDGRRIVVERADGVGDGEVRAYLLGTIIGALLLQRGLLPLHASAVAIDGEAHCFLGHSGAGKSTLAMHLVDRGAQLLCDDICAVDLSGEQPRMWPGLRNLKLWQASLSASGRTSTGLEPLAQTEGKFRLPIARLAADRSYPVAAIHLLKRCGAEDAPHLTPLAGAAAAAALIANSFRGSLIPAMALGPAHLQQCATIAGHIPMWTLERPWDLSRLDEIALPGGGSFKQ